MKIETNNQGYKDFQTFFKDEYNVVRRKTSIVVFTYFLNFKEEIKQNKDFKFSDIKNIAASFLNMNKKRIIDGKISDEHTDLILHFVNNYEEILEKQFNKSKVGTMEFLNATITDEDDEEDGIIPNNKYSYVDLIENLAVDKNINHIHNTKIPLNNIDFGKNTIQRSVFNVMFTGEISRLPITYEVQCPICSNKAIFTENDLSSDIYCTHNRPDNHNIPNTQRHKLKIGANSTYVKDLTTAYIYMAQSENNDDIPITVYSLVPLNNRVEVNYVFVSKKSVADENIIIVFSVNGKTQERTGYDIIEQRHHIEGRFFLEDIFEDLKLYLKKEHGIIFDNSNKFVSYITILTALIKTFHRRKLYSFVIGYSGSGKSFNYKILAPLFTGRTTVVDGGSVSKNIILGGTSSRKNINGSSMIVKGVAGTQDLVLCDESTNKLNEFLKFPRSDNLFSMIKTASGDKVPKTTQGTYEYDSVASFMIAGNLEQLYSREMYLHKVMKKFKQLGGKTFDPNVPLYKPISYYKRRLKDEKLARAHYEVRTMDPDMVKKHYITMLPPAEMARFTFFTLIEDDDSGKIKKATPGNKKYIKPIHRDQIYIELKRTFSEFDILSEGDIYEEFFMLVSDYIYDDFLKKDTQNYYNKQLTSHENENIFLLAKSFFLFQKQFYGHQLKITTEDKKYFEDFMAYNYNTLSTTESNMESFPFYNNYTDYDRSKELNSLAERELEEEQAEDEKNAGGEVNIDDLPDDVFNLENDMEDM